MNKQAFKRIGVMILLVCSAGSLAYGAVEKFVDDKGHRYGNLAVVADPEKKPEGKPEAKAEAPPTKAEALLDLNVAFINLAEDASDDKRDILSRIGADTTIKFVVLKELGVPSQSEVSQQADNAKRNESPKSKDAPKETSLDEKEPKKRKSILGKLGKIIDSIKTKPASENEAESTTIPGLENVLSLSGVRGYGGEAVSNVKKERDGTTIRTTFQRPIYLLVRKGSQFISADFPNKVNKCYLFRSPTGKRIAEVEFEVDERGRTLSHLMLTSSTTTFGDVEVVIPEFTHRGVTYRNGALIRMNESRLPIFIENRLPTSTKGTGRKVFAKIRLLPKGPGVSEGRPRLDLVPEFSISTDWFAGSSEVTREETSIPLSIITFEDQIPMEADKLTIKY